MTMNRRSEVGSFTYATYHNSKTIRLTDEANWIKQWGNLFMRLLPGLQFQFPRPNHPTLARIGTEASSDIPETRRILGFNPDEVRGGKI